LTAKAICQYLFLQILKLSPPFFRPFVKAWRNFFKISPLPPRHLAFLPTGENEMPPALIVFLFAFSGRGFLIFSKSAAKPRFYSFWLVLAKI